jgi:hypothetical protein
MKKNGLFCKFLWGKTGKSCRVSTENRKTGKPENRKTLTRKYRAKVKKAAHFSE